MPVGELLLQFDDELAHHAADGGGVQTVESNDVVEAVAKLRREGFLHRRHVIGTVVLLDEAHAGARRLLGPRVGGHHQNHIAKVGLAAVVVGQAAVVHHLQQNVEHIRMRLLNLVEQQHRMRVTVNRFGQQTALVESDIARRRADEPRHGVPLHILGHVESNELDAERGRQLLGDFGFADAGGAGKQQRGDGLVGVAQAGARHLNRRRQRRNRRVLAEHQHFQIALQGFQRAGVGRRHLARRNARDVRDHILDVAHADGLAPLAVGCESGLGAGFVDDIDGGVRQLPLGEIPRRQFHRGAQRRAGVFDLVVGLKMRTQTAQNVDRFVDARLGDIDFLETPGQRPVFLKHAAVFAVGGGADAFDFAGGQHRLQQVGRIQGAAGHRAGADDGVNFVDE